MVCFKDENICNESIKDEKHAGYIFKDLFPPRRRKSKKHIQQMLSGKKVDDRFYYDERYKMFNKIQEEITSSDTVYQWRRKYVRRNKSNEFPTLTAKDRKSTRLNSSHVAISYAV